MFQYFMQDILREHLDIFCVGLLDDVIVYSATPEEHVGHVRTILAILRQHQLYAKIQKCEFHKEEMTFVGYQVSKSGIGMDPAKVAAILDWPTPKNLKEVQSFLCFSNFYRKFIDHYNTLTSPLTSLTRTSAWGWGMMGREGGGGGPWSALRYSASDCPLASLSGRIRSVA